MSQNNPATEQEWMTQVLNIHGTPFEHLCEHHLRQSRDWGFRSNKYPVEFPPSYMPQASLTKNSELDLWSTCQSPGIKIEMLVECKKNNPDYTDWVFFPARHSILPSIRTLEYQQHVNNAATPWTAQRRTLYLATHPNIPIADDGRETKGNYQEKWQQIQKESQKKPPKDFTKTSNAAITDAAHQIALATQSLLLQERRNSDASAQRDQPIPPWIHVFLPLIVTTAKLWTCKFPAEKVDNITGEIPFSEAHYQTHPYLFFTYALPPIFQFHPGDNRAEYKSEATWEELARFSILVVQSAAFPDLLTHLSRMTKDDYGKLVLPTL